jgi:hypothetical protein
MYNGLVAGVIGCSAGFSRRPSKETPFVFFGTAGIRDFNYRELKNLNLILSNIGIPHRIKIFEGGHQWPPKAICAEAVEWMEIQAMKAGKREIDETLVQELFEKRLENARTYEKSKKIYKAYSSYKALADDFKGLKDVNDIKEKIKYLKDSKEVKRHIKEEIERDKRELNYLKKYQETLEASSISLENPNKRERLLKQLRIANLRKQANKNGIVAKRLLDQFSLQSRQLGMLYLKNRNYARAVVNLEIVAEIMPDDSIVLYNLACAYSLKGEKEKAIKTLQMAVKQGLTDVGFIEKDRDLEPLRREAGYKKIIKTLKKKNNGK